MIIKRQYIKKYLLQMVIDQLVDDFTQKGYEVKTQYPIFSNFRADLYAVKEGNKIAVVFVDNNSPMQALNHLKQLVAADGIMLMFVDLTQITLEQILDDTVKTN